MRAWGDLTDMMTACSTHLSDGNVAVTLPQHRNGEATGRYYQMNIGIGDVVDMIFVVVYWNKAQIGNQYRESFGSPLLCWEDLPNTDGEWHLLVVGVFPTAVYQGVAYAMMEKLVYEEPGIRWGPSGERRVWREPANYVKFEEKLAAFRRRHGWVDPHGWTHEGPARINWEMLGKRP